MTTRDDDPSNSHDAPNNVVRLDFRRTPAPPEPGFGSADEKRQAFATLIERGKTLVTLDARRPGVRVPPKFQNDLQLGLNFSLKFYIDDFLWDERGVRATLSFQGQPYFCDIPWHAIYAMQSYVDQDVRVWPEAMPDELLAMIPDSSRILRAREEARKKAEQQPPPAIADAPAPSTDAPPTDVSPPDDPEPPKPRPGLRLVKS